MESPAESARRRNPSGKKQQQNSVFGSCSVFSITAGVGCGRFSWKEDDILPGDFSMAEILEERLSDLDVPLVVDLPLGHGLPNFSLPLGRPSWLNAQTGQLS